MPAVGTRSNPARIGIFMSNDRFVIPAPSLPSGSEVSARGAGLGVERPFVSRAGLKMQAALHAFPISVTQCTCADLGANVGGFTDCLLRNGASKVYAVDTAYGVLAWTLRKDPRVIVKDRTNALHVRLPEPASVITVDVGWTRQEKILPHVATLLPPDKSGDVLTLIKPHYESELAKIQRGILTPAQSEEVLWTVIDQIRAAGWILNGIIQSPLEGQKGNIEYIAWLRQQEQTSSYSTPEH